MTDPPARNALVGDDVTAGDLEEQNVGRPLPWHRHVARDVAGDLLSVAQYRHAVPDLALLFSFVHRVCLS